MTQQCKKESCRRTDTSAVKIDTSNSTHIHAKCEALTKDCCTPDVSGMAGRSGLYNNLIHEQNPGENVWHYYEKVTLIGEGSISIIYMVKRKQHKRSHHHAQGSSFSIFCKCLQKKDARLATARDNDDGHETPQKDQYYALKMIDTRLVNDEFLREMKNEIDIFRSMDHPNILKAYETFHKKQEISIIMELCTGRDLYERLPYSERQAANIMAKLLSAVAYMHSKRIIHRDLKFENIMFESKADNAEVKIIDFGLSKKYLDPNAVVRDRVGTVYTMAPEVIEGIPYSFKADTFSLGVITYMLLSRTKPFWGSSKSEVAMRAKRCIYNFNSNVWDTITDDAKDFVSNLLTRSISDRLSAEEAKHHPWLAKISLLSNTKPDQNLMTNVEESLIRYSDSGEFKKLVLNVLAQRTTTNDIQELRTAFQSFDTENNGYITHKEFKEQLSRFNFGEAELDKIFNSVDVGKTGDIRYNEFIAATLETQHQIEETKLRDAFDRLDTDGTGFISKKNLCCILGELCTDEYVNTIINEVDANGDGLISFDEFIAAFRLQKKNDIEEKGL